MPNRNICQCPNPPGGVVTCAPHQLAICRVVNGEVKSECVDPPRGLAGARLYAWVLEKVTQLPRERPRMVGYLRYAHGHRRLRRVWYFSRAERRILARRKYHDPQRGMSVRFVMPKAKGKSARPAAPSPEPTPVPMSRAR
jgi:hypothetical protein